MLNPVAKKWVKALRSGKYRQTRGRLHRDNGGYCCLGVLCELAIEDGVIKGYDGNDGRLPEKVRKWGGLRGDAGAFGAGPNGDTLVRLNDSGHYNFKKIADLIESEPEGLFRK